MQFYVCSFLIYILLLLDWRSEICLCLAAEKILESTFGDSLTKKKKNHSHSASTKLSHISLKSLTFPFSSYRQNIRSEFGTSFVFSRCYYFKRNQRNKNVAREKFRNLLIGRLLFFVTPSYTDSWNGMTWNVVQTGINSRFQCTRGNL